MYRLIDLEEQTNEYIRVAIGQIIEQGDIPVDGGLDLNFMIIPGFQVLRGFAISVEWTKGFT
jgi:hypothetical protein